MWNFIKGGFEDYSKNLVPSENKVGVFLLINGLNSFFLKPETKHLWSPCSQYEKRGEVPT